jgi:D-alanyl-D-alanine carboxypeptidase
LTSVVAQAADNRYASIVVDAKTGKTLFSENANSRRYPASLTKMMTLYITFEALAAGKIRTTSRVPISAQAAAMPPTKLGVKAGGSITVEQAILALVTKSANDAAAALGEFFAGSEPAFARMMTAKAHSLGMSGTVFRNASGLPDPGQFTTARDMATLGLALREHFPQYYPYFSTRSFTFGRQRMPNHNRLLGRVKGVDGIKTGYTRASGFNLVSSVSDGNRRIVAVVMGGQSGASRDNRMAQLIATHLPRAGAGKGGPLIAKAGKSPIRTLAAAATPKVDAPMPDIKPLSNLDEEVAAYEEPEVPEPRNVPAAKAKAKTVVETTTVAREQAYAAPAPVRRPKVDIDTVQTASIPTSGWVIQVASSPSRQEAQATLDAVARKAGRVLASASPFTVEFDNGGVTYHRARFGGFGSKTAAWNACTALKKQKIGCYAIQN